MNCKIPFTKDIVFEKKLYEITSISLEHEIKVEDGTLNGNFIVTGDFKSHEVSVNKEAFSYVLPFVIDLTEDIDIDTIEFMIDDFTYEVVENNTLRVNIDFNVIANKKEVVEEAPEEIFRDAKELFQEENEEVKLEDVTCEENIVEVVEDIKQEEVVETRKEEKKIEEEKIEEMDTRVPVTIPTVEINETAVKEEKETVSEETIINSINGADDEYTTYHIHMVSDGESVETICTMYNSNVNILSEYNDLNDLVSGDKLIIPDKNE